jgi:hypothetical protein
MVGQFQEDNGKEPLIDTVLTVKREKKKSKKEKENQMCCHCFWIGHSRPTSLNFLLNKNNMEQQKEKYLLQMCVKRVHYVCDMQLCMYAILFAVLFFM